MNLRTNVKLNFGLNVIRKRPDGYHDIETLFVPCHEFGDTLEVITGDDYSRTSASLFGRYGSVAQGISEDGKLMISIARDEGIDWDPLKDLCAKAYSLLAEDFKLPPVKIFLEKTAPVGAGLGGGSADAAFTLKALNELCSLGLSNERLSEYASRLGSDCAFFIWNRPMFGTGRGEILEPFELDLSGYEVKVLVPEGISVSTKEAYDGIIPRCSVEGTIGVEGTATLGTLRGGTGAERSEASGGTERSEASSTPIVPSMGLKDALMQPVEEWNGLVVNDFEATVFKKHPELAAIKQSLYDSGAVYAAMSGSGSAVFAMYRK
jgi:4-diphosphocytidyl-2-C-methyl-D-erythritol kinase